MIRNGLILKITVSPEHKIERWFFITLSKDLLNLTFGLGIVSVVLIISLLGPIRNQLHLTIHKILFLILVNQSRSKTHICLIVWLFIFNLLLLKLAQTFLHFTNIFLTFLITIHFRITWVYWPSNLFLFCLYKRYFVIVARQMGQFL